MTGTVVSERYRILELIGSGGMANVYKAFDIKTHRTVALKMLKDEHRQDADFVRRFEREAEAVLSLSHENIVKSYDVGEDGECSYIVLEYVEGHTAKDILTHDGAFSPRVAVSIASQVLLALSHAHARGIIHRDVKPQNVIITSGGRAKLTDFGIARDVASTTRTFAGTNVIGSVHYLSPEQARGDEVTAESDIYSCGIMLYEMLLGEVPFGGENSVAIALKHLHEEIRPPIEVNPKLSRALSDIIVKATSKKASMRYHSATEMREDLQRALREPHGRFARIKFKDKEKQRSSRYGVLNIALLTFVAIGLFTAMFFILRAWRDGGSYVSDDYIVPSVQGKKLEEGMELALLRGFELNVSGYEESTRYPEGVIVSQTPVGGTVGKPGVAINVMVSSGSESDIAIVPGVEGMTYGDAVIALEAQGLKEGYVDYLASDQPVGQVLRQDPAAGEELVRGDEVDLWISGTKNTSIEMPNVTTLPLAQALSALRDDGFQKIRLHFVRPESEQLEETVQKQTPATAMLINADNLVELWVYRSMLGEYAADIAENIDIEGSEQMVTVTIAIEEGLEAVLYESTLPVGVKQPVSFTGYVAEEGSHTYTVYVNNAAVRTSTAVFTRKK